MNISPVKTQISNAVSNIGRNIRAKRTRLQEKANAQLSQINKKVDTEGANLSSKVAKQIPGIAPSKKAAKIALVATKEEFKEIRDQLGKKLNDIERVDEMLYDYATIIKPALPKVEDQKAFEQWMSGIAYFLGSPSYDHNLFFNHMKDVAIFQKPIFKKVFKRFTNNIVSHATPLQKALKTADKVKNIAIMYPGSGGGGHKSPATAMAKNLEAQGYKVKLIDIDEFERPYDPKVGGLTRGEIYTKIYQQQGNPDLAYEMWNKGNEMQPLSDRRYMRDLTDTLRNFNTDHLFVVAHHEPEHASLAYQLGVPTTYVNTDNEFHCHLQDIALNQQELKKPLVNFTALSDDSEFYHTLLSHEGKGHYNELPENVRKQMVRMNFPVRENFSQVTKEEKMDIRRSLGIQENATVVKLAMGANGIPSDIKMIMQKIKEEAHLSNKPLHLLVVCGANKDLKTELDQLTNELGGDKLKIQILGFLDEKEMSDFDKASDVWVTKPGGSTSAEAGVMKKQMLYLANPHHHWELTNAHALEKENLAEELRLEGSIMDQINRRAAIGEDIEYRPREGEMWVDHLAKVVERNALPILAVA